MKPVAWQVCIGNNGQTQYADWIHYYTIGRGGCPLNEDGTWIEGHPYHWKTNDLPSKRLQLISVKELYTADQLREAQVKAYQLAAQRFRGDVAYNFVAQDGYSKALSIAAELDFMADAIIGLA